jgi:hypothetical protein
MVGGRPLGDSQFVHSTLSRKVDSILKDTVIEKFVTHFVRRQP